MRSPRSRRRIPQTARAAVDRIVVQYEVLPAVLSLDEALAPGAPLVHDDAAGNVAHQFSFERGDVDAGFQARATSRSKARGRARASGTPRSRRSDAWRAGKRPRDDVVQHADAVSRPRPLCDRARRAGERRCASSRPKSAAASAANPATTTLPSICALLARKSGRPVKLDPHPRGRVSRRATRACRCATGCGSASAATAASWRRKSGCGRQRRLHRQVAGDPRRRDACATTRSTSIPARAAIRRSVYTNLVPTGAFRGFGNPSADWAVEQAWDLAAEKLGMDVVDLLRMNAVEPGDVLRTTTRSRAAS